MSADVERLIERIINLIDKGDTSMNMNTGCATPATGRLNAGECRPDQDGPNSLTNIMAQETDMLQSLEVGLTTILQTLAPTPNKDQQAVPVSSGLEAHCRDNMNAVGRCLRLVMMIGEKL